MNMKNISIGSFISSLALSACFSVATIESASAWTISWPCWCDNGTLYVKCCKKAGSISASVGQPLSTVGQRVSIDENSIVGQPTKDSVCFKPNNAPTR